MDGRHQDQDKINMTRALEALSPYLENPRRIVIRNEAFVAVATAMFFLQLILGPWRRRSGHWFVQGTLWLTHTASFSLITYTLGQMVTSPVKNMLYPFWALILLWASGCANAFMAYSIDDNKQWKRNLFELLQYSVYLLATVLVISPAMVIRKTYSAYAITMESLLVVVPLFMLTSIVLMGNLYRVVAGWMAMNSSPSKLVADYMRAQVQVNTRSIASQEETFTMNSCKYLVQPNFTTIEAIWGMTFDDDSLLKKQLRDVCLSFALSHLLRRRYFEMDCAEAGLPETLKFALEGLLPVEDQDNHYSGAFHVIEVELGFLYDLFFTKHAALFSLQGNQFDIVVVGKLIFTSVGVVLLIWCPPTVITPDPIMEVGTRRVDVTVTVVIMGALLLFEVLQAILYLTSDWAAVSLACSYARGNTGKLMQSIIRFLRRFIKFYNFLDRRINLFGYWQNKMGQSSVIGGNLLVNQLYVSTTPKLVTTHVLPALYNLIYQMSFKMKNFVAVPDLVKSYIVSCLRIYGEDGGSLTNGKAALERNGVLGDFSSALENDSQIKVMLIWHIATEYCNIASSDGAEEGLHQSDAQQVAATLSKYCAYLMYFVPELLAKNSTDTLFIVNDVLKKVQTVLGDDKPTRHRLLRVIEDSETIRSNQDQTVVHDSDGPDNHATIIQIPPVSNNTDNIIHDSGGGGSSTDNIISDSSGGSTTDNIVHDSSGSSNMDNIIHDSSGGSNNDHTTIAQDSTTNNNEDSIFIKGLKLGRDLEAKDVDLRWKVMAEFWAETIIYIAPSDKATEHMERLAQGGEFLTHVWALLSHAGILKRDHMIPIPDQMPTPDQMQTPEDRV